ncbi:MAG: MazG family protein, partial [Actinomycetes bacterium]
CPWDAEQTHRSLSRYLLEEAYETAETIEGLSIDAPAGEADLDAYALLADELGDVLYQVVFHSILAEEAGAFTMADVSRGIQDKLIRRHPHVFGEVEANTSDEVLANWEMIKQEEKGTSSIIEGISASLPSVLYALKLFRKAETLGLLPEGRAGALAELDASVDAVRQGVSGADDPIIGDLLAAAVALSRADGADAEAALRAWTKRFRAHFLATEALAASEGVDLRTAEPGVARALWGRAG